MTLEVFEHRGEHTVVAAGTTREIRVLPFRLRNDMRGASRSSTRRRPSIMIGKESAPPDPIDAEGAEVSQRKAECALQRAERKQHGDDENRWRRQRS
jgi:hypothetical protein